MGALCPCQLPDAATAAAVAALSTTSASTTVLTMAFGGCLWEATHAHFIQHDIPKCQRLNKVHPFIIGSGVRLRMSRVFSPCNSRRRGIGRGLAMGSPFLPVSRPVGLEGSVPGGVPVRSSGVGSGWEDVVNGVLVGRSKDWRAAGSGWPRYWPCVSLLRSMVNKTGVQSPGSPKSAVVAARMQAS